MRTYKEYLIPETIDHKELRYLVSIGNRVLVKIKDPNLGNAIVELVPENRTGVNYKMYPLLISDIYLIKRNIVSIYFIKFYIG